MNVGKGFQSDAGYYNHMKKAEETAKRKPKAGRKFHVGEYAEPSVRWLEGVCCPVCGCEDLMDALGMGLCVNCNKFVRPEKKKG